MKKWLAPLLLLLIIGATVKLKLFEIRKIICFLDNYPCPLAFEPVLIQFSGQNIFKLKTSRIKIALKEFDPVLAEVRVSKKIPDQLIIDLTRRRPLAKIALAPQLEFSGLTGSGSATLSGLTAEKQWLLDTGGELYESKLEQFSGLPQVMVRSDFNLGQIQALVVALKNYYVGFEVIGWIDPAVLIVKTLAGPYAIFDPAKDLPAAVASLQYILTGLKIETSLPSKIDLRFDKPILIY